MSKGKNKLLPKLRFPEFVDKGEWQEQALGGVCSNIASGKDKVDENGGYDLYGSTGVIGKTNSCSYDGNYILVARVGANAGLLTKASNKFGVTDNTLVLFLNNSENLEFIFYTLEKFGLNKLVFGSGQPLITGGQLKNLIIYLPNPHEQQKIADCLSSLDDLIAAESQKLDALKTHKKGLMQQLFPAEGETVPKLRFEGFKGDWVVIELGQLGNFTGGGTPSKSNESFWEGNIPWISSSDIDEDSIHQIKISRFISEESLKQSATKLVPANSILIVSRVGVGKLAITKGTICTSQDFTNFTPVKDNLTFLAYYLKSMSNILLEFSQGMAIKGFTKEDVSKLKLLVPPDKNKKEQKQIAECLSSLDKLITAQTEKIEALQKHKKGLTQGLFPKVV